MHMSLSCSTGRLGAAFLLATALALIPAADGRAQVPSVSSVSDVRPTDRAFGDLQSLGERYGCFDGYAFGLPDRALTRQEFAAGLNACIAAISELTSGGLSLPREDVALIRQLQDEFAAELAILRERDTQSEPYAFSPPTGFEGEIILLVTDALEGPTLSGNTFFEQGGNRIGQVVPHPGSGGNLFQSRVLLTFETSFTGEDVLGTRFDPVPPPGPGNEPTFGVFLEGNVITFDNDGNFDVFRSGGNDLGIVSPQGPGSPSGGGVRINDFGIGFADVVNGRWSSDQRTFGGSAGVKSPDVVPGPISLRVFAGVGGGGFDSSASFSGQTAVFNGVPQVDFQQTVDVDGNFFSLGGGAEAVFPFARTDNAVFYFEAAADGQIRFYDADGNATLSATPIATERQPLDTTETVFAGSATVGVGAAIGPNFRIGVHGGVITEPYPKVMFFADRPATLGFDNQAAAIFGIDAILTY